MKRWHGLWAVVFALPLAGASTSSWEMTSYQDFLKGRFTGVSLTRDGRLVLAPGMSNLFDTEQPAIWSVAAAPDGSLYLGTGHRGRVFRVDASGRGTLLWTAGEPEVFAVAVDAKGVLYAATSPNGKIYRIENGKASEYFNPKATYIWSLAVGADGELFAGTGEEGRIYRISGAGKGEVWYETGQSHITALAIDVQGRLLAGAEPNGLLYRISAKDQAFVLYDANLPEIRAITPMPDGTIYAAALGGSVAKKASAAAGAAAAITTSGAVTMPTTSITVTDSVDAQSPPELKPKPEQPKQQGVAPAAQAAIVTAAPVVEYAGIEKSAIYQIHPDQTVETLWSSKEENVYDLYPAAGQLLFATDRYGRVYRLTPERKLTLVVETGESETVRLLPAGASVVAATANNGKLFRIGGAGMAPTGSYEAPVHDAGSIARWGRLSWRGEDRVVFRTRSGNSARPDRTWSEWSPPADNPKGSAVASPNARYVQWRAEFSQAGTVDNVALSYLPQNSAPVVKMINVVSSFSAQAQKPLQAQGSASAVYSITVTDTGDAGPSTATGTPTQAVSRATAQQLVISWQAEDPDNDRLLYSLMFRGEGEHQWKALKTSVPETSLTIDGDVLADGRYYFRVVASDRAVNAPASAREADLVSAPILIDNTPPLLTLAPARWNGAVLELDASAADTAGGVRRCEYSVDAGSWVLIEAADGVTDSAEERFELRIDGLAAGEHVVVVRVYDAAGNAGLAKAVVRR